MTPSAEHADPTGDTPSTPHGQVIHMSRRGRGEPRGRRTPPPARGGELTPAQRLAETMEALFQARGRTLADDATANIYRTSLDAVLLMLDGSHAEGLIGEAEHRHLRGMIEGMWSSPDEL